MILIIKIDDNDDGDWGIIEGQSAAEKGSTVAITHKDKYVGQGKVIGFRTDRPNRPIHRFASHVA